MPVTVRLNHAIADGSLVANVFRLLEQEMLSNQLKLMRSCAEEDTSTVLHGRKPIEA